MATRHSTLYDAFDTAAPDLPQGFVAWLAAGAGLPARLHVLDVGCGTGRMLGSFARQGWRVTGLEPDPDYRARAVEVAAGLDGVSVQAGGWETLEAAAAYHLVTAVNGPFAYLLTGAARADALRRAYRALRPGGILFLDLPNLLWILHDYRGPSTLMREDGERVLRLYRHHEIDYDAAVFRTLDDFTVTYLDGRAEEIRRVHDYAITTSAELRYLLAEAGFTAVSLYNSYRARAPERLQAEGRLLVSARKPPAA